MTFLGFSSRYNCVPFSTCRTTGVENPPNGKDGPNRSNETTDCQLVTQTESWLMNHSLQTSAGSGQSTSVLIPFAWCGPGTGLLVAIDSFRRSLPASHWMSHSGDATFSTSRQASVIEWRSSTASVRLADLCIRAEHMRSDSASLVWLRSFTHAAVHCRYPQQ